jgi:hypothetical protein
MKKAIFLIVLFSVLMLNAQHYKNVNILVWDNDKGATFRNPDNIEKFIGFEYNMVEALKDVGFDESVNKNLYITSTLPSWKDLVAFSAVIVICGPRPYTDEILSSTDRYNLREYLDMGGCLYIEGNNIAQFLNVKDKDFLNNYFNNNLTYDGGTTYTGYDTIVTDTNSRFCRPYTFIYPSGTAPDISVDGMGPSDLTIGEPYYYSVLIPGEKQGKLYKSTATAYTPPATKAPYYFPGKTFMQTTAFGAYSFPVIKQDLADSIENQLIRASYLRDILRFFSIGQVLVVKDDGGEPNESEKGILNALNKFNINYDIISIPLKSSGPSYSYYTPYATVLWYTGDDAYTLSPTDTTALGTYMTFGGNLIMSSENVAEDLGYEGINEPGTEFPFLEDYLGIDYISSKSDEEDFTASKNSYYYDDSLTHLMHIVTPTSSYIDIVRPFARDTFIDTAFYAGKFKAPAVVSVVNVATTHKSVYMGFTLEWLDWENIEGFTWVTFENILNYDLLFTNTGSKESNIKFAPYKKSTANALISYSNGFIFVKDMTDIKVIDIMGRKVMNLNSGYTKFDSSNRDGIYFVIGKCGGETVKKSFIKF